MKKIFTALLIVFSLFALSANPVYASEKFSITDIERSKINLLISDIEPAVNTGSVSRIQRLMADSFPQKKRDSIKESLTGWNYKYNQTNVVIKKVSEDTFKVTASFFIEGTRGSGNFSSTGQVTYDVNLIGGTYKITDTNLDTILNGTYTGKVIATIIGGIGLFSCLFCVIPLIILITVLAKKKKAKATQNTMVGAVPVLSETNTNPQEYQSKIEQNNVVESNFPSNTVVVSTDDKEKKAEVIKVKKTNK